MPYGLQNIILYCRYLRTSHENGNKTGGGPGPKWSDHMPYSVPNW